VAVLPAVLRPGAIRRVDTRALGVGSLTALLLVAVGPFVLPDFMVNNLIRAFLYAAVALTVDVLWGTPASSPSASPRSSASVSMRPG